MSGDYDATYRIERPDGDTRWVRDRAFPVRDARADITVNDNGPGIPEDVTLFKPLATTQIDSLGLGLSVSRSLAESHGGSLTVTNRGGDSGPSAFMRRLPRRPSNAADASHA